jgi:hypothetical protein
MDANVTGRFFRASDHVPKHADLPDLLLAQMDKSLTAREHNVADQLALTAGASVLLRVEHCEAESDFVTGQFCRKQMTNIPPQAGPDGLSPITLPDGQGIGHLAAFRYHRPTRVLLLQNNIQCASCEVPEGCPFGPGRGS